MTGFPKNLIEISKYIEDKRQKGFFVKDQDLESLFQDQASKYMASKFPDPKTEGWTHFPFAKLMNRDYQFTEDFCSQIDEAKIPSFALSEISIANRS